MVEFGKKLKLEVVKFYGYFFFGLIRLLKVYPICTPKILQLNYKKTFTHREPVGAAPTQQANREKQPPTDVFTTV